MFFTLLEVKVCIFKHQYYHIVIYFSSMLYLSLSMLSLTNKFDYEPNRLSHVVQHQVPNVSF